MKRMTRHSISRSAASSWWRGIVLRSNPSAFTSIELLIVIAVLVVVTSLLLPAFARSNEKNIRVLCTNNQRQLYTSLQIYCNDNADKLPLITSGNWPWDVPTTMTTAMTNSGCTKKTFYCPSTAPRFTDLQNWSSANSLWNYGGSTYSITGYTYALGGPGSDVASQYQNSTILTEAHSTGPLVVKDTPATRELVTDAMISTGNALPGTAADNFASIAGGFSQSGATYPHLSSHLGKSQVPAGGNIAYKDGHVQWRKFDASNVSSFANNTKVRSNGSLAPYFWW